jgi:hypothetical protein
VHVDMYQLYVKLRYVKVMLEKQNVACYGNLKQKVVQAQDNLDLAQKRSLLLLGGLIACSRRRNAFMLMYL